MNNLVVSERRRSRSARQFVAIVLVVAITAMALPGYSAVDATLEEVRRYARPEGLDTQRIEIVSEAGGITALAATTGDEFSMACTVIIAGDERAVAYQYRYNDDATACVGVLPTADKGFFIRGTGVKTDNNNVVGFTARISAEGEELWSVHDQLLVGAQPRSENGTGAFVGSYVQPSSVLAYSERYDRLVAFTLSDIRVGMDTQTISQAHIITGEGGRLRVSGQTFGQSGVGRVTSAVTSPDDGHFVIHLQTARDEGSAFYRYNGNQTINTFKPLDENWSGRYLASPMKYSTDGLLHLLWTITDTPDADTYVSVVDNDGRQITGYRWYSSQSENGEIYELGLPGGMSIGDDHIAVWFRPSEQLIARLIDRGNGDYLGLVTLSDLDRIYPITFLTNKAGGLKLLGYNYDTDAIHEYLLHIHKVSDNDRPDSDRPDSDSPGDEDANDALDEPADGSITSGCQQTPRRSPVGIISIVVIVFMGLWRSRCHHWKVTLSNAR